MIYATQCFSQFPVLSDIHDNARNVYLAFGGQYFLLSRLEEEEEESTEKDRRILRDVDRRWILSVRRDRETFYESFYERLYEPRTELGPRVRFCYTRAVTAMSPPFPSPLKPRGALFSSSTSLSLFLFYAASQRVAFSLSILESALFFIIIISVVNTSLPFDRILFSFFVFLFFSYSSRSSSGYIS